MTNKTCTQCKEIKTTEHFHKNKSRKDGFADSCKECARDAARLSKERKRSQKCSVVSCKKNVHTKELCQAHYERERKFGDVMEDVPIKRYAPPGSGTITPDGYKRITMPEHPNATKEGRVLEHVKVMAEMLGRPLIKGENVHHINGVRDDNRPENLELWNTTQPSGQRIPDKVAWALEILRLYGPEYLSDDTPM